MVDAKLARAEQLIEARSAATVVSAPAELSEIDL
jgi:hypothetical protein